MATVKVLTLSTSGNVEEVSINTGGGSTFVFVTIDFGLFPINEASFNIIDANCTTASKIDISQYNTSQTEENFGVKLELYTEVFNGNFNIIAVSPEPFSKGIFKIKYTIL